MTIRRTIELTGSDSVKLTAMQYWNQPAVSLQIGKGRYVTIALAEARELAGWLIEHAAEDPDAQPTNADEVPMRVDGAVVATAQSRELAGWLIEHAAEDPDAQPTTAQSRGSMGGFSQFTSST